MFTQILVFHYCKLSQCFLRLRKFGLFPKTSVLYLRNPFVDGILTLEVLVEKSKNVNGRYEPFKRLNKRQVLLSLCSKSPLALKIYFIISKISTEFLMLFGGRTRLYPSCNDSPDLIFAVIPSFFAHKKIRMRCQPNQFDVLSTGTRAKLSDWRNHM